MPRVLLIVETTAHGTALTWSDGAAAFAAYEVPSKSLTVAAEAARRALGAVVECHFAGETGDRATANVALATAGYGLYQALFKPAAEQQSRAAEVRKWLDRLSAEGAVEGLEVIAEGGDPVPWNLVYDRRPDPKAFQTDATDSAPWQPFWGVRYDLAGGRRVSPLRRFPVLENPRVVVVADPLVLDGLSTEREELRDLCLANKWALIQSRAELVTALQAGRPDILYWLGHTQTDPDPFGLVLGEDVITPDELRQLLEGDPFADEREVFGGIAFLNACGTATRESSGSFLEALHPLGLSGYIATEQSTLDTFAAPLGREFLTAFALKGEPLGDVMRLLRGRVPLGLLYGTYCPPLIRVRRDAPVSEIVPVVVTTVGGGKKLGRDAIVPTAAVQPLPANPYRSLQSYGASERALFAGRDEDVLRFAQVLDEPNTRLVILHGESGVGKTSFLRAGLLPYLEGECVGYRFARDRSKPEGDALLFVRATNDPVSQIATAVSAFCSMPFPYRTPVGEEVVADLPTVLSAALGGRSGRDAVRDALTSDPACLGHVLSALARHLPFTPVLVIDQAEEVFTLARTEADEANRAQALEMLRRAASRPTGVKVVVSLRTEYHGRFTDRLRKGAGGAAGVRDYLLTDVGLDALIEVIRRPTATARIEYASEIPADKYQFRFAKGVAEEIARRVRAYTINRSDSVLPLVQVICSQLYDLATNRPDTSEFRHFNAHYRRDVPKARTVGVVTLADLDQIGGVEGGMKRHAEELVRRLFPRRADQKAFKRLLSDDKTQLFLRQSDGTLTTALLPAAYLARHWSGQMPFEQVLHTAGDGDWRLLRVNSLRIGGDEHEHPYVSLGHDALAKVAARWNEEHRRRAQLRKYSVATTVLLGVVGALTVLTGWALEERKGAERAAKEAKTSAAEAEEARKKADEHAKALISSQERLNRALAKSLLGPIRPKVEYRSPLALSEVEALWQITELRQKEVPLIFTEEATRTLSVSKQLENRTEFALHTVIGLDQNRRDVVDGLLLSRMRGEIKPDQSVSLSLVCSRWGSASPALAAQAKEALLNALKIEQKDSDRRDLAQWLSAVVVRLPPNEAERVCARAAAILLGILKNKTKAPRTLYYSPQYLAEGLSLVAARMEPNEAAKVLLDALELPNLSDSLRLDLATHLAKGLLSVSVLLEPSEAAKACARAASALLTLMGNDANYNTLHYGTFGSLWEVLSSLVTRMDPTAAVQSLLNSLKNKPRVGSRLGDMLLSAAKRMEPTQGARTLFNTLKNQPDPISHLSFAEGLSLVAVSIEPIEAAKVLLEALQLPKLTASSRLYLAKGLSAVSERMEPANAADGCARAAEVLLGLLKDPNANDYDLWQSVRGLLEIIVRMEPTRAANVCAQTAEILLAALKARNANYSDRRFLARGLSLVAARMEPTETAKACARAAEALLDALGAPNANNTRRIDLAEGLSSVAAYMEPTEAAKACARAAEALLDALGAPNANNAEPRFLAEALSLVAAHMEPTEAAKACNRAAVRLLTLINNSVGNDRSTRRELAKGLVVVSARLDPREALKVLLGALKNEQGGNPFDDLAKVVSSMVARMEPDKAARDCAQTAEILLAGKRSRVMWPSINSWRGSASSRVGAGSRSGAVSAVVCRVGVRSRRR